MALTVTGRGDEYQRLSEGHPPQTLRSPAVAVSCNYPVPMANGAWEVIQWCTVVGYTVVEPNLSVMTGSARGPLFWSKPFYFLFLLWFSFLGFSFSCTWMSSHFFKKKLLFNLWAISHLISSHLKLNQVHRPPYSLFVLSPSGSTFYTALFRPTSHPHSE